MMKTEKSKDHISRADAIEAVIRNRDQITDQINEIESLPSASVEVIHDTEWVALRRDEYEDFLASAEAVQGEWIPCSERLPEDLQKAITCNKHGEMMIGTYTGWGWIFPCYFEKPIAWMPLPKPYREDGE